MPSSPRKPSSVLLQSIQSSAWPILLFAEGNQLRYLNMAAEKTLQVDGDEVLDQIAKYHGLGQLPEVEQLISDLCPANHVWSGDVGDRVVSFGDEPTHLHALFLPLFGDGLTGTSVRFVLVMLLPSDRISAANIQSERESLHAELQSMRRKYRGRFSISHLVGVSAAMIRVRRLVDLASQSRIPVLVQGMPGTGKQQVARTICYASSGPSSEPLLAIQSDMMDAERLQQAVKDFVKKCVDAEDSSRASLILLDIDQLELSAQGELFHLLDWVNIDLRMVSTSQESLLTIASRGEFREDLAYRIQALEIQLPSLAERPEDIPYLAQAFLEEDNLSFDKQLEEVSAQAIDLLQQFDWHRNMDQLAEVLREARQHAGSETVEVDDLPESLRLNPSIPIIKSAKRHESISLDEALEQYERRILRRAIDAAKGNKTQAAALVGISRARLHRRMEQLKLD